MENFTPRTEHLLTNIDALLTQEDIMEETKDEQDSSIVHTINDYEEEQILSEKIKCKIRGWVTQRRENLGRFLSEFRDGLLQKTYTEEEYLQMENELQVKKGIRSSSRLKEPAKWPKDASNGLSYS